MILLNLGCGDHTHPDWVNVDLSSRDPLVMRHDVTRGLPFGTKTCDVAYSSHMLEHLRLHDARRFLAECYRVLRPGGIIRIVVPDLEGICREYLAALQRARANTPGAEDDHEWMVVELFDQASREMSGGRMAEMLRTGLPNEEFVFRRIGDEGTKIAHSLRGIESRSRWHPRSIARKVLERFQWFRALRVARFQLSGEKHQWMYDSFSLSRALAAAGFVDCVQRSATTSAIPRWGDYGLDADGTGVPRKPDSLYMEARRPLAGG